MARFSVDGDEEDDRGRERPANSPPRSFKKPRTIPVISEESASSASNLVRQRLYLVEESMLQNSLYSSDNNSEFGEGSDQGVEFVVLKEEEAHQIHKVQARPGRDSSPSEIGATSKSDLIAITDPDVLDCPICLETLSIPVYQCENGHVACSLCCNKMSNKCGSCCSPIGYNRCRAIEKVLQSIKILCKNMEYGCTETLHYGMKLYHDKTCQYAPCSCPHPGCEYIGMSNCLYKHFAAQHSSSSRKFFYDFVIYITLGGDENHVFYQNWDEDTLFILNRSVEPRGSFVSVICVAHTSLKRYFEYELTARNGVCSINLKASAEFVPKWNAQLPAKTFLVIPNDFSVHGELSLQLIIRSLI